MRETTGLPYGKKRGEIKNIFATMDKKQKKQRYKMNYVKVFLDWAEQTSALSCEEFGSLMRALISYAGGNNEPELVGSAKYLFPVFRIYVDREAEAYEKRVEQCSRAGKRSASERKRNAVEQTLTDANEINEEKEQEQEKEQEKE